MKKILIIILCLMLVLVLVACDTDDKGNENKQSESNVETTNPPGYHSINVTMTTDDIYTTEPYSNFIPSKEAISAAGFINTNNYLLGESESEKPWTCLNMSWKAPTYNTAVFYVTVMHINCPYPYGANSSDNTPQTLTFDSLEDALAPNSNQRKVTVQVGDYVATYTCYPNVDITAADLYALVTSAQCFNTAE